MKPSTTTIKTYVNQPSYCGQKLKVRCEVLSPVCRQFTLDPEQSTSYSFIGGGLFSLIDLIVVVFAIGSKLPIASLLNDNFSTMMKNNNTDTIITSTSNNNNENKIPSSDQHHHNDFSAIISSFTQSITSFLIATVTLAKENPFFTVLLLFLILRSLYRICTRVPAERLTVIQGVGLQLNKQNIFGKWSSTELVDVATITSLVINEAFFRHRVVFYLAIACQDRRQLVLPFANTLPQLCVLRTVLRGTRAVLYNEPEEGLSLADIEAIEDEQ